MSGLFFDACWIVGGILTAAVLYKGFHAGWFTIAKTPPTVRITPEVLRQYREEIVWNAIKQAPSKARVVKADFQTRGNGQ